MGIMDLFKRRQKTEPCPTRTDNVAELDRRQHDVARRLHVLEYEVSAEVQAMKHRIEEDRRHRIRREEDR